MTRNVLIAILDKMGADYTSRITKDRAAEKVKRYAKKNGLPDELTADEVEALTELNIKVSKPEKKEEEKTPEGIGINDVVLTVASTKPGDAEINQMSIADIAKELKTTSAKIKKIIEDNDDEEVTLDSDGDVILTATGKKLAKKLLRAATKEAKPKKEKKEKKGSKPSWIECATNAVLESKSIETAQKRTIELFEQATGKETKKDGGGRLYVSMVTKVLSIVGKLTVDGDEITHS